MAFTITCSSPRPIPERIADRGTARSPGEFFRIPGGLRDLIIVLPYNDFEMIEETMRARWFEVAAVIVEPIAANMTSIPAQPGWLAHIRRLCDEFGVVMIVDEVKQVSVCRVGQRIILA
jgi:glutamate-1-semialdehyde 2,1-aminomutase